MSTPAATTQPLPAECLDDDGVTMHVGGETFKVARCRLVQASPVLRDMISLGSASTVDPGPVVVDEVDAGAFRDFLWVMFVSRPRPSELTRFLFGPKTAAKADKLFHIAQLSHKFQDFDTLDWAIQQLHNTLPEVNLDGALLRQLFSLLELLDGDSAEVLRIVADLREALRKQLAYVEEHGLEQAEVPPRFIDPVALIRESAENESLASLRADAYYHLLLMPRGLWASQDSGLSDTDKQRMLSGALLLGEEWTRLRGQVSPNSYALPSLDAQVATKRPSHLLERLHALQRFLSNWGRSQADGELKRDVEERISSFNDKLPEYFNGSLF